jgi:xylulokinase
MSKRDLFVGLDLGTTACKAVLFTSEGTALHRTQRNYPIRSPQFGWAEQDPEGDWWVSVREIFSECKRRAHTDTIKAIGICGQRESVVAVDKSGKPLRNAILWMDGRSAPQLESIRNHISEAELFSKTGLPFSTLFVAPKILWLKENEPKIYDRTYKFLSAKDYINLKFTGSYSTDHTLASRTMFYDIVHGSWDEELIQLFGFDWEKFPAIADPKDAIEVARTKVSTGFEGSRDLVVATGAGDAPCTAFGYDVINEGDAMDITGTSSLVEVATKLRIPPVSSSLLFTQHISKEKKLLEGGVGTSGAIVHWFINNFCSNALPPKGRQRVLEKLESEAAKIKPSEFDPLLVPYFAGSTFKRNNLARGIFFGLADNHDRSHLFLAILEGVAFAIRETLEACEALGIRVTTVLSVGGGSRSPIWSRVKADVTRKRYISFGDVDAGCVGAARLACIASGKSPQSFQNRVTHGQEFFPDKKIGELVARRYQKFLEVYRRLAPLFGRGADD